ncbi:MAG: hypothetical protein JRE82_15445 [Deltaproteobacteria bacterium]|nr:hypothetical protein [Deltaproteobacteria bacterium]
MDASLDVSVGAVDAAAVRGVGKGRLLGDFAALVSKDRSCTADLLVYIGEIDRRKLYLEHAYPSMFAFCTKRFRMSEAVAARRIRAGRTTCRFPCILGMVRRGELHLSGVHQLAGHLTEENHREVLRRAKHRSMGEIDVLIAEIAPKADVAAMIRALPRQRTDRAGNPTQQPAERCRSATERRANLPGSTIPKRAVGGPLNKRALDAPARKPRGLATPLSPRRYKLQVTIGQEARDKLAELQALLSHRIPDGDVAAVIEQALDALLVATKKRKAAVTERPRGAVRTGWRKTRAIPARVRREVFERDEGRCAFVDGDGRRCGSSWQVEFHHRVAFAKGGVHGVENVELRCRGHNQYEAELEYGREFMAVKRRGVG